MAQPPIHSSLGKADFSLTQFTMEREKEKLPPLPEGCSVTTTVDAQRDASTKSLVSRISLTELDLPPTEKEYNSD